MSLYEDWVKNAYDQEGLAEKSYWDIYLPLEQKIYERILSEKLTSIEGTVTELSESFNMSVEQVCGFLDGISEALPEPITASELEPDSNVALQIDFEKLYKKMVEYKAEHLYGLPEWDGVIDAGRRKELYYEQKKSGTIVKGAQPGRNDPCPCGSGKKYKKCCGA